MAAAGSPRTKTVRPDTGPEPPPPAAAILGTRRAGAAGKGASKSGARRDLMERSGGESGPWRRGGQLQGQGAAGGFGGPMGGGGSGVPSQGLWGSEGLGGPVPRAGGIRGFWGVPAKGPWVWGGLGVLSQGLWGSSGVQGSIPGDMGTAGVGGPVPRAVGSGEGGAQGSHPTVWGTVGPGQGVCVWGGSRGSQGGHTHILRMWHFIGYTGGGGGLALNVPQHWGCGALSRGGVPGAQWGTRGPLECER